MKLSTSSNDFISFSFSSPIQQYKDPINGVTCDYRQGGPEESEECVVIIPGIYDSTNSSYLVARSLIKAGLRVLIVSIPQYETIQLFLTGFDLLTAYLKISKIHLVGIGFGGFLSLFIDNFKSLCAQIESIVLISSYLETKLFGTPSGFLASLTAKSDLIDEILKKNTPKELMDSVNFMVDEIKNLPSSLLSSRIKLRAKAQKAPLPKLDHHKVLIIQPTDWAFKFEYTAIPQKMIHDAKYVKIDMGGHHPHLANPDEISKLILEHISNLNLNANSAQPIIDDNIDD